jgi:hypothetical protein
VNGEAASGGPLTFSRDLNLLIDTDIPVFFHEAAEAGRPLPVQSPGELRELVQFGKSIFPDSAFSISAGLTAVQIHAKHSIGYDLLGIILPAVHFLYTLRGNARFIEKVGSNLANLPQFNDTLFELRCLEHFTRNGFDFEYEPTIIMGNKEKHPDLLLAKDGLRLFVECKQVRTGQGKGELQFANQCNYAQSRFPESLSQELFDRKLRLDVNFRSVPTERHLDELGREISALCEDSQDLVELPIRQIGDSIEYALVAQSTQGHFPMRAMRVGRVLLRSNVARRIWNPDTDSPEGELLFTSTDLARRRRDTIVRLIREARGQLPVGESGLVILGNANLKIARPEIEKRIQGTQYGNVTAFVVNPFDDFYSSYRTRYRDLLLSLFEGFQSVNPFLQA